ncbi:pol [Symbiodinium sp. CCMP2592]|nr:pol [Symbiodinium sp. CCMP2592]
MALFEQSDLAAFLQAQGAFLSRTSVIWGPSADDSGDLGNLASLVDLRELVPALPYFPGDLMEAGGEVAKLVQQYETQADEAQACFGQPTELREAVAAVATHPAQILREQSAVWSALWTRSREAPFDPGPLRQVLSELPRPLDTQADLQVSAEGLCKATQRMLKKACGSDGWEARDLLRLPPTFWEVTATLTSALVVLLPKADGRTRPVGLLSILWRAGARCLVKQLRGWVGSWTTAQAMGGIAGVGIADTHLRLMGAHRRGCRAFVKQDLSHFFDSLTLDVLLPLMEHYKAPAALCRLVEAMYCDSRRLFKVEQFTSSGFITANRAAFTCLAIPPSSPRPFCLTILLDGAFAA